MKRQRAFLDQSQTKTKRAKTVAIVPLQPKLNKTQEIQVRRMLSSREETKTFVAGALSSAVSLVPVIVSLTNIPLGQTDNTRIGNHVHLKSLKGRVVVIAGDATNITRVIIFKWKENDAFNPPSASQILAVGPSGGVDVYSTYNTESPGNYQILEDYFLLGSNGTSSPHLIVKREMNKKLTGKAQFWSDIGTAGTNKIYIMFQSDSAAAPNPAISFNFETAYGDN